MPRGIDLLIILFVVILIFGASRLPQIGGALGKSITAFKKETAADETPTREITPTATSQGE